MPHNATKTCEGCRDTITADQIVRRQAGLVGGVLLCPKCIARKREELAASRKTAAHSHAAGSEAQRSPTSVAASPHSNSVGESQGEVWIPPIKEGKDETDDTLTLVSEDEMSSSGSIEIRSFATGSTLAGEHRESDFKRPLAGSNEPATRCRTFHGKLTEAGLAHMDEQINDWLDDHPDIYIKNSASTVGVFEGKSKEPHLLVTLFY